MDCRKILVFVAEMILAELSGRITLRLQGGSDRAGLCGDADIRTGLAHGRKTGSEWNLASDEICLACCAARLGIVIGEPHLLAGKTIEVRCLAGHDVLVVSADVEPTYVVAHDKKNVWLLRSLRETACQNKKCCG